MGENILLIHLDRMSVWFLGGRNLLKVFDP